MVTLNRLLSLLVAVTILAILSTLTFLDGGVELLQRGLVLWIPYLLLCLILIWFGEPIDEWIAGVTWRVYRQSPGWMVQLFGWVFLFAGILVYFYFSHVESSRR